MSGPWLPSKHLYKSPSAHGTYSPLPFIPSGFSGAAGFELKPAHDCFITTPSLSSQQKQTSVWDLKAGHRLIFLDQKINDTHATNWR